MNRRLARLAFGTCAGAAVMFGVLGGLSGTAIAATDWGSTPDSTIFATGTATAVDVGVSGVRIYTQPEDREFTVPTGKGW